MTEQDRTPQNPQESPQGDGPPVTPAEADAHTNPVQTKAAELRAEEAKQQERKRNLIILGVVALVAIVAAVLFFWVLPEDREAPENPVIAPTEQRTSDAEAPDDLVEPTIPPVEPPVEEEEETGVIIPEPDASPSDYAFPGNVQEDGGVSFGSDLIAGTVNEGAPVMDIYLDYSCDFCRQFEETHADDITQLLTDGEVTVVYHTVAMLDQSEDLSGFSGEAANAVATVANFAPGHYYDFVSALFTVDNPANASLAEVQELARSVDIPEDSVEFFGEGYFKEWVEAKTLQFYDEGFQGTPTVLIDGQPLEDWTAEGSVVDAVTSASAS